MSFYAEIMKAREMAPPVVPVNLRQSTDLLSEVDTSGIVRNNIKEAEQPYYRDYHIVADLQRSAIARCPQTNALGVGFGGWASPGQLLLVAPLSQAADLSSFALSLSSMNYLGLVHSLTDLASSVNADAMPPGISVLRPGEVLRFGRPYSGVAAAVICPYSIFNTTRRLSTLIDGYSRDQTGYGPLGRPMVRVYSDPGSIQSAIPYDRVPGTTDINLITTEPATGAGGFNPHDGIQTIQAGNGNANWDSGSQYIVPVGYGATHVTMIVGKSAVSAGSPPDHDNAFSANDVYVAWVTPSGLLVHNHADDWDAAGRGQAFSPGVGASLQTAHTVEVYEVPANMIGLTAWTSGSDTLTAGIAVTDNRK